MCIVHPTRHKAGVLGAGYRVHWGNIGCNGRRWLESFGLGHRAIAISFCLAQHHWLCKNTLIANASAYSVAPVFPSSKRGMLLVILSARLLALLRENSWCSHEVRFATRSATAGAHLLALCRQKKLFSAISRDLRSMNDCYELTVNARIVRLYMSLLDLAIFNDQRVSLATRLTEDSCAIEGQV